MLTLKLLTLTVVISAITAGRVLENKNAKATQIRDAPGRLICNGGDMEYHVPDLSLFELAFLNPSVAASVGASVESIQIGSNSSTECLAQRYPRLSPSTLQTSSVAVVNFEQCGFTAMLDPLTNTIRYSNNATIKMRLPSPQPAISVVRRKTFLVDLHCDSPTMVTVSTPATYFERITFIGSLPHLGGILLSAKSRQEVRPSFGSLGETVVHIITVALDDPSAGAYDMVGHRCWATPDSNPFAARRYEFITPRGCQQNEDFVTVTSVEQRQYVYEVADFEFEDHPSNHTFFHCEVNVCAKADADRAQHCAKSCPSSLSDASDYALSSAAVASHLTLRPNVVIDANGAPRNQSLH
ncbi:hypothetical protein BV898_12055 [Hypsibius exemplaris]|uniref:ZP domain-containing protein n=1 Tax=Hypsibius exemplaris TaxID=2072580 RepID=A0A1W0WEV2_HYPEX|nr:hypothetical protein BV898_12055 [Hypsibius exemplaris]